MVRFPRQRSLVLIAGMALGLALFYMNTLPLIVRVFGAAIFFSLALLQPDLAILFVPLAIPLYLIPASLGGLRDREILLPLHEVTLGLVSVAAGGQWVLTLIKSRSGLGSGSRSGSSSRSGAGSSSGADSGSRTSVHPTLRNALPLLLFLAAGLWGVWIALPASRPEALRELRWLVLEPVIFYLLLKSMPTGTTRRAVLALIVAGSCVALIGILQYIGIDLVPLIGAKRSFSENIVEAGSARRVASVYGHPNNLGLFLGRVWPLAAALLFHETSSQAPRTKNQELPRGHPNQEPRTEQENKRTREPRVAPSLHRSALCALRSALSASMFQYFSASMLILCLAGLFVSFSRGAWLGAAVAVLVLALCGIGSTHRLALPLIALGIVGASLALLVLTLRGVGGSEGTRILLWQEALGYLQQHPLGIGLDQFYAYHNPDSGRSLIDPALVGTSEQYAAHPHNLLLDILLRMGPLGLIAFGWLVVRFVRKTWQQADLRSMPLVVGILAAMAAALTHGLVDQFYFVPDLAFTFWLVLATSEISDVA